MDIYIGNNVVYIMYDIMWGVTQKFPICIYENYAVTKNN